MNKNKNLISKYLEGELDSIAAARFEEDLKNDPLLLQELELYKEVDEALADSEVLEFRMQLREMHSQISPEISTSPKPRIRRAAYLTVAASLSLLIVFSAVNLLNIGKSQKLLARFYQPYEITSVNRSGISEADRNLRNAMEKYQNKEYREAVSLFEKVLLNDPTEMSCELYSGISYFEIEEYRKAGNSFSKVIEHNDNLYIEQAKWYLGFCYLKTEEKDKAIKQFTQIANSKSFYNEKAREILKKL